MTTGLFETGIQNELADRDFEQIVLCRHPELGVESVIAIHDTSLGPALGGVRMRRYPSRREAIADALDLAQAMTYKAALAGLPLGGGKSVINVDANGPDREAILIAHAQFIGSMGGRYIPGVDMGTTVSDLELIGRYVPVVCSKSGDPSYHTARGVVHAIEAALEHSFGGAVDDCRVAIQGLGNVGFRIAEMLTSAGAEVVAADVDSEKVRLAVDEFGIGFVSPEAILRADVDVVVPCAAGRVVDRAAVERMRARAVVGAANNMLDGDDIARHLADRNILHVPDFVANAGGLIAVEAELRAAESEVAAKVDEIGVTARAILRGAELTGLDVVQIARDMARARVLSERDRRPYFPRVVNP